MQPRVEIKLLDPRLRDWGLPAYQSAMAAAVDLFACLEGPLTLEAAAPAQLIPAGFSMHIADPALAAIILPRSGLGHRHGLVLGNLLGLIDADYTGPIMVSAWNRNAAGSTPIVITPGTRIAQMMFLPIARASFAIVEAFSSTSDRGEGGFGSTG